MSADEPTPDGCVRAEGWQFLIGGESDMVENPPGRQVSPTQPLESGTWSATGPTGADGTVTIALTPAQQSLLAQGGLRLSELQQQGFAFGTLRCGLDNRNGDNAEHMGAGRTACVAYNVGAPVTVTKRVEGTIPQGPFEFTISCGNTSSTFTLDGGATTTLWMPYDTDCSLVETNDGGADSVSFAINGGDATSNGEGEGEEAGSVLEFDYARSRCRAQRRRAHEHRGHEHRCVGRCLSDEGGQPRDGGPRRARVVHAHRDERRSRPRRRGRAHRRTPCRAHVEPPGACDRGA